MIRDCLVFSLIALIDPLLRRELFLLTQRIHGIVAVRARKGPELVLFIVAFVVLHGQDASLSSCFLVGDGSNVDGFFLVDKQVVLVDSLMEVTFSAEGGIVIEARAVLEVRTALDRLNRLFTHQ